MFSLNYPMFSHLLSTWNVLGHLPDTQGYYLDYVGKLRPSKSYGLWGGGVVVAHEILVSAQGPLVFGFLGLGPGLDNIYSM